MPRTARLTSSAGGGLPLRPPASNFRYPHHERRCAHCVTPNAESGYSIMAEQTLMEAGQKMEQNPKSLVELVGHTDRTGSNKYNLLLGERRAESVKRFLADRFGISLYRMFTLSYGKEKPLELPDQANASHKNRRVKIVVWGDLT